MFLVGTMVAETVLASAVRPAKAAAKDLKERMMSSLPVMMLVTEGRGKKMQERAYLLKSVFLRV